MRRIKKNSNRHLSHLGTHVPVTRWTYDITKSYDWNYEFGPFNIPEVPKRDISPTKTFLTFKLNSLFGVPAGPLLNSKWIKTYADLGFDILTYKTVRTKSYPAHSMPHVLYVEKDNKMETQTFVGTPYKIKNASFNITNSFGVPSKDPDLWQHDVQIALKALNPGQLLILSIMGTIDGLTSQKDFINDFAKCAFLAQETKAPVIEVNLSCPNLHSGGIVCYDTELCKNICNAIKNVIGDTPLIAKIGYFKTKSELKKLVSAIGPFVDGIAALNTIQGDIVDRQFKKIDMRSLGKSGVCGDYIKPYGIETAINLNEIREELQMKFAIIGIGGVTKTIDYKDYINNGADAVQSATGAMMNPQLAYAIYKEDIQSKSEYNTAKSIGDSFFVSNNDLNMDSYKKIYMEMLYPKMKPESVRTLFVNEKPFQLKHGEKGRKTSFIYLNHRNPIFLHSWDRKLLSLMFESIIVRNIFHNKKAKKYEYGVVSIPSSSSPEITALMLDVFPNVKRSVALSAHYMENEKGAHKMLYGVLDENKPRILIDDVFTSGNTMKSVLKLFPKRSTSIYSVALTCRNPEDASRYTKETGVQLFSLTTLDEILKFHWVHFTDKQKKLITKERKTLS